MNLICNLPAEKVWVRREYLRDHQDVHGEFVEGVWVAAKSIPGRAFYFETYLPEYYFWKTAKEREKEDENGEF